MIADILLSTKSWSEPFFYGKSIISVYFMGIKNRAARVLLRVLSPFWQKKNLGTVEIPRFFIGARYRTRRVYRKSFVLKQLKKWQKYQIFTEF